MPSRSNWNRRSGGVSISRLPPGSPAIAALRVRWFRVLPPVHTGHPQPIVGTPTDVPVPNRMNWPRISLLVGVCTTDNYLPGVILVLVVNACLQVGRFGSDVQGERLVEVVGRMALVAGDWIRPAC